MEPVDAYLLATAPAGSFVRGQLLLHAAGALHFLGVKGDPTERAEGGGHLKTWLQTLPTEPGTVERASPHPSSKVSVKKKSKRFRVIPSNKTEVKS